MSTPTELDAWIAEHVMEWRRTNEPDDLTDTDEILFWHRTGSHLKWESVLVGTAYKPYGGNRFSRSWKNFTPTDDAADAMLVLERCIKHGKKSVCCCISVEGFQVYHGGSDYAASVREAKTLPLAICLFARNIFEK